MHQQPRIRVSGLVWAGERLLLIRQGPRHSPRWMLPGGGVEAGESLTAALERELAEEIGLTSCQVNEPVGLVESIAPPSNRSGRHLLHIMFATSCPDGAAENLRSHDPAVHELRMFERDELMTVPLHPPIAGFLSQWTPGRPFAYFGPLWAP